jgi:hypothetical protein
VALLASHVLQNSPQFIVQGVEVWIPRGPIFGADKPGTFFAATPESSWPCGQELSSAGRPISDP